MAPFENVSAASTEDLAAFANAFQAGADNIWMLLCGFLVFWMHAGFTMLEVGSVQHKNAVNIMFKNIGTISIGALAYFVLGYGLAYGDFTTFIGTGPFANKGMENSGRAFYFFQFAFAATAATIVSGAVAGRINLIGYFIIAVYLTGFVYPVVTHWIWMTDGWLSAFTDAEAPIFADKGGCGMIDFAGSGVVHMTGGIAALIAAKILGPRIGRFDSEGQPVDIPPHNISLQTLGVFILWFGWYGFNCGSSLVFDGAITSKVAVTTTLSPAAAVVTGIVVGRFLYGHYEIGTALNCALAGLVSITAPCPVVDDWAAIIIGIIGALVYIGSSKLMLKLKIDDPVDAIAVHFFAGIWGCLSVGIFASKENVLVAYGTDCAGNSSGITFATQLVGVLSIIGWVAATCTPLFLILKVAKLLRVTTEQEEAGLDNSEHGGSVAFSAKTAGITPAEA